MWQLQLPKFILLSISADCCAALLCPTARAVMEQLQSEPQAVRPSPGFTAQEQGAQPLVLKPSIFAKIVAVSVFYDPGCYAAYSISSHQSPAAA